MEGRKHQIKVRTNEKEEEIVKKNDMKLRTIKRFCIVNKVIRTGDMIQSCAHAPFVRLALHKMVRFVGVRDF